METLFPLSFANTWCDIRENKRHILNAFLSLSVLFQLSLESIQFHYLFVLFAWISPYKSKTLRSNGSVACRVQFIPEMIVYQMPQSSQIRFLVYSLYWCWGQNLSFQIPKLMYTNQTDVLKVIHYHEFGPFWQNEWQQNQLPTSTGPNVRE